MKTLARRIRALVRERPDLLDSSREIGNVDGA
jgi:hypothetical protein